MNWKDEAKYLSKGFEDWSSTIYLDSEGIPTFAWGFNCNEKLIRNCFPDIFKPGFNVFQEDAEPVYDVLYNDAINDATKFFGEEIWNNLSDNIKIVLSDMSFAMGYPVLSEFKKLKEAVASGDKVTIRQEIADSIWAQKVKSRATKLISMI